MIVMPALLAFLVGYGFGSIPFGLLLTKLAGAGDLRSIGSGNIGATNVLRTGRKGLAAATLLLDVLKGLVPVVAVRAVLSLPEYAVLPPVDVLEQHLFQHITLPLHLAGLGAFLGHLYPIWLKWKGGKGVATYIGVLLGLAWPAAVLFCGIWLVTALVTRVSSLSALVATVAVPVYYLVAGLSGIGFTIAMSVLIYWKHRDNISRLLAGQESKIGGKS